MPRRQWLPTSEERILKPALEKLPPDLRIEVEADLEKLLADADNPGDVVWTWWKGKDPRVRWKSRVAILAGRVGFRYIVFQDYPYIGPVSLVDLTGTVQVTTVPEPDEEEPPEAPS